MGIIIVRELPRAECGCFLLGRCVGMADGDDGTLCFYEGMRGKEERGERGGGWLLDGADGSSGNWEGYGKRGRGGFV